MRLENHQLRNEVQEFRDINNKTVNARLTRKRAFEQAQLKEKDELIEKLKAQNEQSKKRLKVKQEIIEQKAQQNDTYRHNMVSHNHKLLHSM